MDLRFPVVGVQVAQSAVSDKFEFLVCLAQLRLNDLIVGTLSAAHSVLIVGLVPVSVASNSVEPACQGYLEV